MRYFLFFCNSLIANLQTNRLDAEMMEKIKTYLAWAPATPRATSTLEQISEAIEALRHQHKELTTLIDELSSDDDEEDDEDDDASQKAVNSGTAV